MARYAFRRLHHLPARTEAACRLIPILGTANGASVDVQHVTVGPGGKVPVEVDDSASATILTLSGRGAATVGQDRVELHQNDVMEVEAGCPYALQSIGGVDWTFLLITTKRQP